MQERMVLKELNTRAPKTITEVKIGVYRHFKEFGPQGEALLAPSPPGEIVEGARRLPGAQLKGRGGYRILGARRLRS